MNIRRVEIALVAGAFLGVLCILGVGLRTGFESNDIFLLALWYNRILMGFFIGISPDFKIIKSNKNFVFRGTLMGFLVTSAHFLTSGFIDMPSFLAGIIYGIIIDFLATRYG